MKRPLLAIVLLLAAACNHPAGPPASGPLRVVTVDAGLQLQNLSHDQVFYFVYERQGAALIDWAPCVSSSCPSLAPRAQTTMAYSAIGGYAPGKTEAIVWWWRAEPGPADAPVPGPVTAIVAPL